MTQLVHFAVGYNELLSSIAQSRDMDDGSKAILRLLAFQFFRQNEKLAEYADAELLRLYQGYNGDDEPLEAEVLLSSPGDSSPPDFPPVTKVTIVNSAYDRRTCQYHGPISLRCVEADTPHNESRIGEQAQSGSPLAPLQASGR